jgi:hypothetical protein
MLRLFRRFKALIGPLLAAVLLLANIYVFQAHNASAHNWGSYHWDRSGSYVPIYDYNYSSGANWQWAENARANMWNTIAPLYIYQSCCSHTDLSVFDWNAGNTGWIGLAQLMNLDWDWGCWCYDHISHGHAQLNTYYGWTGVGVQGVYCQEIFHTLGFDHDNQGDCMGLGYYAGSTNYIQSHNVNDFLNKYR